MTLDWNIIYLLTWFLNTLNTLQYLASKFLKSFVYILLFSCLCLWPNCSKIIFVHFHIGAHFLFQLSLHVILYCKLQHDFGLEYYLPSNLVSKYVKYTPVFGKQISQEFCLRSAIFMSLSMERRLHNSTIILDYAP